MRMVGGKRKRNVRTRKLTTSPKQLRTTVEWRLIDEEFIPLHKEHEFTFEACCDDEGLNSHADLPFASPSNSILDNDMSGESTFINPPWGMATTVVAHLEACRAKDVENTKAVIILPVFKQFESMIKDWKIIREWSAGTHLFTRPTIMMMMMSGLITRKLKGIESPLGGRCSPANNAIIYRGGEGRLVAQGSSRPAGLCDGCR